MLREKKTLSFYDWKDESFQMCVSLKWNVSNNNLAAVSSEQITETIPDPY